MTNADNGPTDRIALRALRVPCVVGVHDWERAAPRDLLVDLTLSIDLSEAGRADDLARTVDYDDLAARVRASAASRARRLVETVAEDVADVCLAAPRVASVAVTVHKPGAVHGAGDVSVTVVRARRA